MIHMSFIIISIGALHSGLMRGLACIVLILTRLCSAPMQVLPWLACASELCLASPGEWKLLSLISQCKTCQHIHLWHRPRIQIPAFLPSQDKVWQDPNGPDHKPILDAPNRITLKSAWNNKFWLLETSPDPSIRPAGPQCAAGEGPELCYRAWWE